MARSRDAFVQLSLVAALASVAGGARADNPPPRPEAICLANCCVIGQEVVCDPEPDGTDPDDPPVGPRVITTEDLMLRLIESQTRIEQILQQLQRLQAGG
jgi:hypothetical protein